MLKAGKAGSAAAPCRSSSQPSACSVLRSIISIACNRPPCPPSVRPAQRPPTAHKNARRPPSAVRCCPQTRRDRRPGRQPSRSAGGARPLAGRHLRRCRTRRPGKQQQTSWRAAPGGAAAAGARCGAAAGGGAGCASLQRAGDPRPRRGRAGGPTLHACFDFHCLTPVCCKGCWWLADSRGDMSHPSGCSWGHPCDASLSIPPASGPLTPSSPCAPLNPPCAAVHDPAV